MVISILGGQDLSQELPKFLTAFPGPSESHSDVWKVFPSCAETLLAWTQWQMVATGFHELLLEEPGQSSEDRLALRLFKVKFLKGS